MPQSLSAADAILRLLDNTIPARVRPKQCLTTLKAVVSTAVAIEGSRDEAGEIAPLLLEYLKKIRA